ncbi:hypothetical protein N7517_008786 [Penicillium concentricum]|uniref:RNase H type-1 domain-containing protein n=1 Tax=Penicillium concentricum TaxID=293559 RepID=A0A9W9RT41_9EURO|nr:uncharacterized protein N7517_008786 [Penicillium concentricum]KAJ5365900.1 hypothetical protein N7517_008786 [Penicillium concentricum]
MATVTLQDGRVDFKLLGTRPTTPEKPAVKPAIEASVAPIPDPPPKPTLRPLGEPVRVRVFKPLPEPWIELDYPDPPSNHVLEPLGTPVGAPVFDPLPGPLIGRAHHVPALLSKRQRARHRQTQREAVQLTKMSPDPELSLEEAPPNNTPSQLLAQSSGPSVSRKRKAPPSDRDPDENPRPSKKRNTDKASRRYCWQLGHDFIGFVSLTTGEMALEFSKHILEHDIQKDVCKRLVYFCDGSLRWLCGAAGVVWPQSFTSSKFEGKGIYYPFSIDSTATLELFAIASTLEAAISDLENPRSNVVRALGVKKTSFQGIKGQTRSHLHDMTKELFVFTDDLYALRRISGELTYPAKGDIATQLATISAHAKTLNGLGVHVELHLSPGHSAVPGNEAADAMAKQTQKKLLFATKTCWPTDGPAQSELTTAAPAKATIVCL